MKTICSAFLLLVCCSVAALAQPKVENPGTAPWAEKAAAADKNQDDPAHDELRALAKDLLKAIDEVDIEKQLAYVTDDAVITWQNGVVLRGKDELRDYLKKNQATASKIFLGYKQPPTPNELTILHGGDTGISYGTTVGKYNVAGKTIEMDSKWTATVVKQDGNWKLASFHTSADVLDNPVLNLAKSAVYWTAGIVLLVGLAGGWLLAKRSATPVTPAH